MTTQNPLIGKLIFALEAVDIEELHVAVSAGLDVNAPLTVPQFNGLTPLIISAQWGNAGMCSELIRLGADPHATALGSLAITALGNAAYAGHPDVCRLLLEQKPPAQHIQSAIVLAKAGRDNSSPRAKGDFQETLNLLLWARDGVVLPPAVAGLVAGDHPEIDATQTPVSPVRIETADATTAGRVKISVGGLERRYHQLVIAGNPEHFDSIEIHGVRHVNEIDIEVEVDDATPEFFSTYLHLRAGGVTCVGDFLDHADAVRHANDLKAEYGWECSDYVDAATPQSALRMRG